MFRITRGDDELEIKFTLKFDPHERDWYPDRVYHDEIEIVLSDEENALLMDYFEANKENLLYHNDESLI